MLPVVGVRLIEGRTGSTLLMQLLSTSDAVVFDDRYPAEYRWLSYFARTAEMMTVPFEENTHPGVTRFFFGPDREWGPVPFASEVIDPAELGDALLGGMWAAWSRRVRQRRPGAAMYAEKLAVDVDTVVDAGIPIRVIDLVRDPRDVFASILAFTASGVDGFGRRPGQSDDDFLETFLTTFRRGVDTIARTRPGIERRLVHYEGLVDDLDRVSGSLADWLGIDLDPDRVSAQVDQHAHHITAPSPAESIGRWRRDLAPAVTRRILDELGDVMHLLGYDLS